MTESLSIRPFAEGDFDAVCALWQSCGLLRPWNDPAHDIAHCRANPTSELFVGLLGGMIVASVMVGNDGHRGVVYYVACAPQHQGKGYARAMMGHGEAWLKDRGVFKVNLMIRDDNEKVRDFYRAIGYQEEPRIVMSRRLDQDADE